MAEKTWNKNVRFNTNSESAMQAWSLLHSDEVKNGFKSQNEFIICAINDYYERYVQKKDDPYLETREKEDAFVERIVSQVTEKILTNLPTLAGMYMMQQQAMLTAGLQNAGMPVMNFTADPTNANMMEAGAQKVTKSIKSGMAENQAATKKSEDILDEEPEDNEFLDFSFGM
ncbi:hypothetical protein ACTQ32_15300 [Roseburia faecis]|jgi:hypothetical protein|uniref:hypothetical protein n=1 Tax=Roseburia faecis TaxID=301302 RepID=UPI003F9E28C4